MQERERKKFLCRKGDFKGAMVQILNVYPDYSLFLLVFMLKIKSIVSFRYVNVLI